jgi:NADH-ubiquinone oxidoreductase chain 1
MTEHAAVVFVFFFLAEYGSIVLMCILSSILFLGGYLIIGSLDILNIYNLNYLNFLFDNSILEGLILGLSLGIKSSILIFVFI